MSRTTLPPRRPPSPSRIYAPTALVCPTCLQPLRQVTAGVGTVYLACRSPLPKTGTAGGSYHRRCEQRLLLVGSLTGVALVIALTLDEYGRLTGLHPELEYRPDGQRGDNAR